MYKIGRDVVLDTRQRFPCDVCFVRAERKLLEELDINCREEREKGVVVETT